MFNISECLPGDGRSVSERRRVSAKRTMLCSVVLMIVACALAGPKAVYSQWIANGNDVSNTNTGNVGVGTGGTAPVYKLNVAGSEDKSQIRFGLGAFDSGGFLFSNAPTNAVFSGGASWNGGWFAKGVNTSSIQLNTGTITFFTNLGLTPNNLFTPTARMLIDGAGNVGVGTTTPGFRFDVQGGQVNASGGLCINGDCKTAWSQVGGGGSSQWTTSGSTIFYNAGNVGIGTSGAPSRRLEVLGGNVFHQYSTTAGSEFGFYTAANNNHFTSNLYFDGQWKMITTGKGSIISLGPAAGQAFAVWGDNTSRAANAASTLTQLVAVTLGGNMGVGTGTPDAQAKLHLFGSGAFGQDIQTTTNDWTRLRLVTPSRTWGFFLDGGAGGIGAGKFGVYDYTASAWRMVYDTTGNVGVGTTAPLYSLDVNGGVNGFRAKAATASSSDTVAAFENNSAIQMIVRGNGAVGIGTASPNAAYKLDVQGGTINTSGGLCIAGVCKSDWSQIGSSQWTTTGSNIYYNTGNIGVGNNNPTSKLFVGSGTPAVSTLAGLNVALAGPSYISASNGTVNAFMGADTSTYGIFGTLSNHGVGVRTNNVERMRIDTAGNVGLGTSTPTEKLEVNGNLKLTGTGNITAAGIIEGGTIRAKYQDMAEWVESSQELPAGTVVILDSSKSNQVIASISAYDSSVAGIISPQPGIALGEPGEGRVLVATTGRVRVKVDASNGPINIGDLLVTSDKPGVAMKSVPLEIGGVRIHRPGTLIGKALEPLASGTGEILVLLSLQ